MIVDSLRYWVEEMHVDGFRFDLASILARDAVGQSAAEPAGALGHRVGPGAGGHEADRRGLGRGRAVPGGQLRRRRLEGVERPVPRRRPRLLPRRPRLGARAWPTGWSAAPRSTATRSARPEQSINFVTCHDGFTLNDLVSYNEKHNEANGEDNRDGANDNRSWNCGVEGPTDDPAVERLRNRQVKNFLAVDAAVAGRADDPDGRRSPAHAARQQQRLLPGQRDQLVRLDAAREACRRPSVREAADRDGDLLRDVEHERRARESERTARAGEQGLAWREAASAGLGRRFAQLALSAELRRERLRLPLHPECLLGAARVRVADGWRTASSWRRWIDTALDSPDDIVPWQEAPAVPGQLYRVEAARS